MHPSELLVLTQLALNLQNVLVLPAMTHYKLYIFQSLHPPHYALQQKRMVPLQLNLVIYITINYLRIRRHQVYHSISPMLHHSLANPHNLTNPRYHNLQQPLLQPQPHPKILTISLHLTTKHTTK